MQAGGHVCQAGYRGSRCHDSECIKLSRYLVYHPFTRPSMDCHHCPDTEYNTVSILSQSVCHPRPDTEWTTLVTIPNVSPLPRYWFRLYHLCPDTESRYRVYHSCPDIESDCITFVPTPSHDIECFTLVTIPSVSLLSRCWVVYITLVTTPSHDDECITLFGIPSVSLLSRCWVTAYQPCPDTESRYRMYCMNPVTIPSVCECVYASVCVLAPLCVCVCVCARARARTRACVSVHANVKIVRQGSTGWSVSRHAHNSICVCQSVRQGKNN